MPHLFRQLLAASASSLILFGLASGAGDVGVEGVKYMGNHNSANGESNATLSYTYANCGGFYDELNRGQSDDFYWGNTDCWSRDLEKVSGGGLDTSVGDSVDIFYIETHGNHRSDGSIILAYNTAKNDWHADSRKWELGNTDLEWLCTYACDIVNRDKFADVTGFFNNLHLLLCSYDKLYDGITTDECGEDFASDLNDGDRFRYAWFDGLSDWAASQHIAIVSAEAGSTWNGGNVLWPASTMERDHWHGHGNVQPDIPRSSVGWWGLKWMEG